MEEKREAEEEETKKREGKEGGTMGESQNNVDPIGHGARLPQTSPASIKDKWINFM